MRVLVCGSRTWDEYTTMEEFLHGVFTLYPETTLIHGAARGADEIAGQIAEDHGAVTVVAFPADWEKHGKPAGPIRNQQMLDEGKPTVVIAFVDKPLAESRGTNDMVTRARNAELPTYVVEKVQ